MSEIHFLWGGEHSRPEAEAFTPRSNRWWQQYSSQLRLSREGIAELYRMSCHIAGLLPDPQDWGQNPRPFRGLVVGAVQSGKTSSMLAVSSIALDQGYRIVVILAGGKDDLRRQTARRANTQLLMQRDEIPGVKGAYTLPFSAISRPSGGIGLPFSQDIHQWALSYVRIRDVLKKGEPCIFVIKKHSASLAEMRICLARAYREFGAKELPTLVLDDECDDASVDRTGMPIPEAIANLWRLEERPPVAYVGYTATAAANLLQHPDNELYPEHFATLLRYPGKSETELSYSESNPVAWYTGSECFYEAFGSNAAPNENFLVDTSILPNHLLGLVEENPSLYEAVCAFIVAGAYRLALQPGASFSDPTNLPAPHSMLLQTSPSMGEHERWLNGLVKRFSGSSNSAGYGSLGIDAVESSLASNEAGWEAWYKAFLHSRERLYLERTPKGPYGHASWAQVKALIPEVVRNIRVKIINSDPEIGQDLDFLPRLMEDGSRGLPQDIYVIAIGGSKLSRGITVEGLCVSYFTRWTPNPTDDTVLQISRWFGYRGSHLAFCRLFTTLDIYESLQEIHDNDHDLRSQLFKLMVEKKTPRQAGVILKCDPRSLPTSKLGIGKVYELRFSAYQTVFRDIEVSTYALSNQQLALELVAEIRSRRCEDVRNDIGRPRGFISRDWDAQDVARVLDTLNYSSHNPPMEGNPAGAFHRPPDETRKKRVAFRTEADPYQVAAYLRQWKAHSDRENEPGPPLFDVGVAFGEDGADCDPFDFPLLNREITQADKMIGQWTGRSANWRGDALFDDPDSRLLIGSSTLRILGLKGLLLLYVVHKNATGREGRGKRRPQHTITFGISIPEGGPPFRRVTVAPS